MSKVISFENGRNVRIMDVTPALATEWLATNTHNRPIRWKRVLSYALAMKQGEWLLTSEPISFSRPWTDPDTMKEHGETLIEGQHRLQAIVDSDCTVPLTVWRGCQPEEIQVIGQAAERTNGDVIAISRPGMKDSTLVALVCSAFVRNILGYPRAVDAWMCKAVLDTFPNEVLEVVYYKKRLGKLIRREMTGVLLLAQILNPDQAKIIFERLKTGIGFTKTDPLRVLYLYLQDIRSGTNKDLPDIYCLKVCNAVAISLRDGQLSSGLRLNPNGISSLRLAGKKHLDPLLEKIYDKKPENFYEPKMEGDLFDMKKQGAA